VLADNCRTNVSINNLIAHNACKISTKLVTAHALLLLSGWPEMKFSDHQQPQAKNNAHQGCIIHES